MDFFTTQAAPIAINIDGTAYQLPRFLVPQFKAWAAELIKSQRDAALKELKTDDDRARFLMYFPDPQFDLAQLVRTSTTPDGAAYVVGTQLAAAGVPEDVRAKVLDNGDPSMIRYLAEQLTMAPATLAKLGVDADGEQKAPLATPPGSSAGSPGTGPASTPDSSASTAAA